MRLTSFSDYTLRVLIHLALHPDELTTIQQIAENYGISESHLMKVVNHLARTGSVESIRGKGGGIRLALPAEQIRIGQVVRAAEGEMPLVECLGDNNQCRITRCCNLVDVLVEAVDAFYASLDRYTLLDLLRNKQSLQKALNIYPLRRA